MTRRSISILLGTFALIAGGLVWMSISVIGGPSADEARDPVPEAPRATRETASEPSLARPLHPDSGSQASEATTAARPSTPQAHRESAALPAADLELRDALWVEGRVVVPAGTPLDELVEVVANGSPFATRPLHSSPIAADGTFRVAFARGTLLGTLDLSAKYLYLDQAFTLTPAHPPPDILLAPHLGGRIHGRVVLSPAALPLRSAIVSEGSARADWPPGRFVRTGKVDPDLEFDLPGLPFGSDYQVWVGAPGCSSPPLRHVKVELGRTTFVDYDLDLAATVCGRVFDANGMPANRAQVLARLIGGKEPGSRPHELYPTFSDPSGRFEFPQLPPGLWELAAMGLGHAKSLPHCVQLTAGLSIEDVRLELRRSGRVAGRVLGVDGQPAVYAIVRVISHPPRDLELEGTEFVHGMSLTTDKHGDFDFESLSPGGYRIEARWADTANGGEANHPVFALAEGECVENLVLRIERPGRIEGRVTGPDERPAAGVFVSLTAVETGAERWGTATTDESGNFVLERVPPGEFLVVARGERLAQVGETRIALRPGEFVQTEISVQEGTLLSLFLEGFHEDPAAVTVTAFDEKGASAGTASPKRPVSSTGFQGPILVCTLGPLLPGKYVVEAVAAEKKARQSVTVSGEASVPVRLRASD